MNKISELEREKFALKRATVEARRKLIDQLHESGDRSEKLLRNSAIVAGSLMAGYLLFRLVSRPAKQSSVEPVPAQKASAGSVRRSVRNRLKQRVVQEASLYLLGIARDQLIHYLTRKAEKNDEDISQAGRD